MQLSYPRLPLRIEGYIDWFQKAPILVSAFLCFIAYYIVRQVTLPIGYHLNEHWGEWLDSPLSNSSAGDKAFAALVVAPLVETLICQWLVFRIAIALGLLPRISWLVVILSGLCFGATHFYSPGYIFVTFFDGLVLATGFLFSGKMARAFWVVCLAHAIFNAYIMVFRDA